MKRIVHLLAGALVGAALASCGGGGGSLAEGGIGGTGISSGSISAFGSIVVNGTRFDVDAASIRVNGDPNATQADLEIGYVVRIDGDLDDGVAESVRFDADLIGEVDANPISAGESVGTLTVMQQTVRITATTIVEGVSSLDRISDSAPRDRVLVSGFRNSSGELVATYLEVPAASGTDQIVGTVTARGFNDFAIGSLDIAWSNPPESGERVLVRGNYDPVARRFAAESVAEVEDLAVAGTEIELEGIVANFVNLSSFSVDGVPVDASGATIVDETGTDASGQIADDVEVEVEGAFNSAGVLVAERVEVEFEENISIAGFVETVDPAQGTIGFFSGAPSGVLVTATVTGKTELRDSSDEDVDRFGLDDIAQGDWIELEGFEDGAGNVTAIQIERDDPEDDVSVEGIVDEVRPAQEELVILGVIFDTSSANFEGASSLNDISVDDIVEVQWPAGDMFMQPMPVSEVELE